MNGFVKMLALDKSLQIKSGNVVFAFLQIAVFRNSHLEKYYMIKWNINVQLDVPNPSLQHTLKSIRMF